MPPAKDLTCILLPDGLRAESEIRQRVARFGDVWLRVAPLPSIGLQQIEMHDASRGLPGEDPQLVGELSAGGRATFLHVNHQAPQAMVHGFVDGKALEGWVGAPGPELDEKLRVACGHTLAEISAADDGTRHGIGVAASHTTALVRGRALKVPTGLPTGLGSFVFHDRGLEVGEGTRAAPFIYDAAATRAAFGSPARELAARLSLGSKGPLEAARPEVVEALAKLGDRALTPDDPIALRALELCAIDSACAFGGGDRLYYWDLRVLPVLQLAAGEPKLDADDLEEIDQSESIFEALVDVLPYSDPPGGEGSIVVNLGPGELLPLAPWAEGKDEYSGAIFRVESPRLLPQLRGLEGVLGQHIERFERAWYHAARGLPPQGDAWEIWRKSKIEEGQPDANRFLIDTNELRVVLELAAANQLAVGLLFYE